MQLDATYIVFLNYCSERGPIWGIIVWAVFYFIFYKFMDRVTSRAHLQCTCKK